MAPTNQRKKKIKMFWVGVPLPWHMKVYTPYMHMVFAWKFVDQLINVVETMSSQHSSRMITLLGSHIINNKHTLNNLSLCMAEYEEICE